MSRSSLTRSGSASWLKVLCAWLSCATAQWAYAASGYSTEIDFDRPGFDFDRFEQSGPQQGPTLCRDACNSKQRCLAYTYIRPGARGERAQCLLKDRVSAPVENRCCISGTKGAQRAHQALHAIPLTLKWHGWTPDGSRHRFRLGVKLDGSQEIASITLVSAVDPEAFIDFDDAYRDLKQPPVLSTLERNSILVEAGGKRIEPGPAGSLGRFEGSAILDLLVADRGQSWRSGSIALAELKLADGRQTRQWFTLDSPPDQLIGSWKALCPAAASRPPYKPLAISGQLYMDITPAGQVTGRLGTLELLGNVDRGGTASGTASGPARPDAETAAWSGVIKRETSGPRRGQLRGQGKLSFERHPHGCRTGEWVSSN